MIGTFAQISFLNPWILTGLLALPVLWLVLRTMPPAAKEIIFPPFLILQGLKSKESVTQTAPWWLILLRLLIAALTIIGLSKPVYIPVTKTQPLPKQVIMILENDWANAHIWDQKITYARNQLERMALADIRVNLYTTTRPSPDTPPAIYTDIPAEQALQILDTLRPHPWNSDYKWLDDTLQKNSAGKTRATKTLWLGSGIDKAAMRSVSAFLRQNGAVIYIKPTPQNAPLVLKIDKGKHKITLYITSSAQPLDRSVRIHATSEQGDILHQQTVTIPAGATQTKASLNIPDALGPALIKVRIANQKSAAAHYYLGAEKDFKTITIIGNRAHKNNQPFIDALYYLTRALEPFGHIHVTGIDQALARTSDLLILPDTGHIPAESLSTLHQWVENGGMLLRFAGPKTANHAIDLALSPVTIKPGERFMGGTVSRDTPKRIAPIPEGSPLYGIEIADDIIVRQQLLADPSSIATQNVWATLEDGTPLITAKPLGHGLLVMIHTSANTQWSNLALSGTYIALLKRITALSQSGAQIISRKDINAPLLPQWVLDAYGQKEKPSGITAALTANDLEFENNLESGLTPEKTPPGFYSNSHSSYLVNMGDMITALPHAALPPSVTHGYYTATAGVHSLMQFFIVSALVLFLLDWGIILFQRAALRINIFRQFLSTLFFLALMPLICASTSYADTPHASDTYLAFVKTGNSLLDERSQQGLNTLSHALSMRTSVNPKGVAAIDIDRDDIIFFPFLYWPLGHTPLSLSEPVRVKIQSYLDHGGLIVFDIIETGQGGTDIQTLNIDMPPLMPLPRDHVLMRSYYLLEPFSDIVIPDQIWMSSAHQNHNDGVSSVIVTQHNLGTRWAQSDTTIHTEIYKRFGINLMLYALTGHYKTDQVHIPHILKRLGKTGEVP